jgi:hypothetical protein
MSLYGKISDAIILVFAIDDEIHKVHGGKSSEYAPAPLRELIKE